ncbi:MAG: NAD-dependent succinate-semialdehyde dehydrogenase [Alphaproteobacteria bacterium]
MSIAAPTLLRNTCLIGGKWVAAKSGRSFSVINPATGENVGDVPLMGADETRAAIAAAHEALQPWQRLTALERSDILIRWHDLMTQHADELARILTLEQGKPLAEAKGEITYAASFLRFFGEEARRIYGETIPAHRADTRIIVIKQPVGVAACITPWNFPAAMVTRKLAPALAAGCTAVLKPARQTPLTALAIAALGEQAGVLPGTINIVTGDAGVIGDELCASPLVRKLSFTGSTETGKMLAAKCAGTVKKISLELGGNAAFIVFDDADLDAALEGAMTAKFRGMGQSCVAANRFLVQAGIYDAFAARFTERVKKLAVGNGLEAGTAIGPLINKAAIEKIRAHIADAVKKGAKILTGGNPHALGGNFFEPTVISGGTQDMLMANEETFGPVAALMRFDSEDQAIEIANATPFGLVSYFYTADLARSFRVAEKLESGMVGVNTGFISVEIAPFGGIKESGMGREGSRHGIEEFLELKYLCIGGIG